MAHHRPDLLEALLAAIDDPRNDIYLHIDAKSGPEMARERFSTERTRLQVVPSMKVSWGGPSQVRCTLAMLKAAVADGPHAYYHLITGSSYPLKSQDAIHEFFCQHAGKQFIAYDSPKFYSRVQHYWAFPEFGKGLANHRLKSHLRNRALDIQKRLGIDRFRKFGMEYKKGLAYWSITQELAEHVLSRGQTIRKMTSYTSCADEIFMQVIAWNSPFRNSIYHPAGEPGEPSQAGEFGNSLRLSTWPLQDAGQVRKGHNFLREDLDLLLSSNALFALKFEGPDGVELIQAIRENY